ncbi:MAG TPA: LuxR C-terminal-related transcriptional regulator, partial [Caldilineaceae bacterium]|nr:LuxR C-terminal-related transcriptional regulator [Caldilineaceae bacterium]
EREVLVLLAQGHSNKEIGGTLFLTEATVKGYVSTILSKLHVSDRTQAALLAVRYGLVDVDEV